MKIAFVEQVTGTNRKCAVCGDDALRNGFTASKIGRINKSSSTPLCLTHAVVGQYVGTKS